MNRIKQLLAVAFALIVVTGMAGGAHQGGHGIESFESGDLNSYITLTDATGHFAQVTSSTSFEGSNSLELHGDPNEGGTISVRSDYTGGVINNTTEFNVTSRLSFDSALFGGKDHTNRFGIYNQTNDSVVTLEFDARSGVGSPDNFTVRGALVETKSVDVGNLNTDKGSGWVSWNIDANSTHVTATWKNEDGGIVGQVTTNRTDVTAERTETQLFFHFRATSTEPEPSIYYDYVTGTDIEIANHTVSGFVKDADGNPIGGATVVNNNTSASSTTTADGSYSLALDNGTYRITATDEFGDSGSIEVTVNGSDLTNQNITILNQTLKLDVNNFMDHGTTQEYTVTLGSEDVTDSATVTSSDTGVITVDQSTNTLTATSDTSVNERVTITAEFEGNTVERNVTVANRSVKNLPIMPDGLARVAALIGNAPNADGDRPGGTQLTMRIIFVATLAGIAATVAASSFAGIGAMTIVMTMGWFMGWVGDGMAMVTVFVGLFIGLNVATNIDYSVRRD